MSFWSETGAAIMKFKNIVFVVVLPLFFITAIIEGWIAESRVNLVLFWSAYLMIVGLLLHLLFGRVSA
jgi:hypothetical protein